MVIWHCHSGYIHICLWVWESSQWNESSWLKTVTQVIALSDLYTVIPQKFLFLALKKSVREPKCFRKIQVSKWRWKSVFVGGRNNGYPKMSTSKSPEPATVLGYLAKGSYPGWSRWVQCNHEGSWKEGGGRGVTGRKMWLPRKVTERGNIAGFEDKGRGQQSRNVGDV